MARINREEREAERQRQYLRTSFDVVRENVTRLASMSVYNVKDGYGIEPNDQNDRQKLRLLGLVNDVVYAREALQRNLTYVADCMLQDVKRLESGRQSDDITRNSSFNDLPQQIALFNYRLKDICIRCEAANMLVVELHPTKTRQQLVETVAKAQDLSAQLCDLTFDTNLTEHNVATARERYQQLERELR